MSDVETAARRWGVSPADYEQRAVLELAAVERPGLVMRRTATVQQVATAMGEDAESLTRRAVVWRMAADAELFATLQSRIEAQAVGAGNVP